MNCHVNHRFPLVRARSGGSNNYILIALCIEFSMEHALDVGEAFSA